MNIGFIQKRLRSSLRIIRQDIFNSVATSIAGNLNSKCLEDAVPVNIKTLVSTILFGNTVTKVFLHAISYINYVYLIEKLNFKHVLFISVFYVSALVSSFNPPKFQILSFTAVILCGVYCNTKKTGNQYTQAALITDLIIFSYCKKNTLQAQVKNCYGKVTPFQN